MKITTEMLEEKKACYYGINWFTKNFPNGEANHKAILKKLDEQKNTKAYAVWLIVRFKLSGIVTQYHANGQLWEKSTYKNGQRHGEHTSYYENGQPCTKSTYKNGQRHGEHVEYYDDGQLGIKSQYKNGLQHGERVVYRENGQLWIKSQYKNGIEV